MFRKTLTLAVVLSMVMSNFMLPLEALAVGNSPVLEPVQNPQNFVVGQFFSYQLVGTDADVDDVVTYHVFGDLPNAIGLDTVTGLISGTPDKPSHREVELYVVSNGEKSISQLIQFTSANVPPVAQDALYRDVSVGLAKEFNLSAIDADGDKLTYTIVQKPTLGTIEVVQGATYKYIANADTAGQQDTITFQVNDGQINSNIATVTFEIDNNPPVLNAIISPQFFLVGHVLDLGVLATDLDNGTVLTYSVSGDLPPGVTFNEGLHSFVGTPNVAGEYSVTVTVTDGKVSDSQIVLFRILAVADIIKPVTVATAAGYGFNTWTNNNVTVDLNATDEVGGSGIKKITARYPDQSEDTTANSAHKLFFENMEGEWEIAYYATDYADNIEAKQTFIVKIDKTAPIVTLNGAGQINLVKGNVYNELGAVATDDRSGLNGGVVVSGDVDVNTVNSYEVTYTATDNAGNVGTATRTVVVKEENIAPVAKNASYDVFAGGEVLFNLEATDDNGDPLTYTITEQPVLGTIPAVLGAAQKYIADAGTMGQKDVMSFRVNDGQVDSNVATVTFNILNNVPVLTDIITPQNLVVGEAFEYRLAGTDADVDDVLSFTAVGLPDGLELNGGLISGTPITAKDYEATIQVKDVWGGIDSQVVLFKVVLPNIAPVAQDASYDVFAGKEVRIDLVATDVNGDDLTYPVVAQPAHGVLTPIVLDPLHGPALTYTADAGFVGQDTFTFKAKDGHTSSDIATITLNVLNNVPVLADIATPQKLVVGEAFEYQLVGTDFDAGDNLTYNAFESWPDGLELNHATGLISGAPTVVGDYTINFTVGDGRASDSQRVLFQVIAVDLTKPVTTVTPVDYEFDTWTKNDVIVNINAADEIGGSGIKQMWFLKNLGGVNMVLQDNPSAVIYDTEDNFVSSYYSVDNNNNTELNKFFIVKIDKTAPVVTLNGADQINLTVGDAYNEPGAVATDALSGLNGDVVISGDVVDVDKVGTYNITYTATDNARNVGSVTRKVVVEAPVDITKPVTTATPVDYIFNTWTKNNITVNFSATDEAGGSGVKDIRFLKNIGDNDVVLPGNPSAVVYDIEGDFRSSYFSVDNSGNIEDNKIFTVKIDKIAPTVTLNGNAKINLAKGAVYNELGAVATDALSGLNGDVVVAGDVDVNTVGSYDVTYTATDNAGNVGIATRTVKVEEVLEDITAPITTATPVDYVFDTWTKNNVTVNLNAADEVGGAGLRDVRFKKTQQDILGIVAVPYQTVYEIEGEFTADYYSTDHAGHVEAGKTFIVKIDKTAPVVTLNGAAQINLVKGNAYNELGTVATDARSGLKGDVVVAGDVVNVNAVGTYNITYTATDNAGNVSSVTRKVVVEAPAPPQGGGGGSSGGGVTSPYNVLVKVLEVNQANNTVKLNVTASSSLDYMLFNNTTSTANVSWSNYVSTTVWTFSSAVNGDTKVYTKLKNSGGESNWVETSFKVERPQPIVTVLPQVLGEKISLLDELIASTKFGEKSEKVRQLQGELKKLGYFVKTFKPTNYYGAMTKTAVAKYLASKKVAGVKVTNPTLDELVAKLKLGSRGAEVSKLQTELKKLGYMSKYQAVTGYYGPVTKTAVNKYLASK